MNGLRVTRWPMELGKGNLKLVHLSDLHLDDRTDLRSLQHLVACVNQEQPDMVVFTGDIATGREPYRRPEQALEILRSLHAPLGKYAVRGNHDLRGAAGRGLALIQRAGFRVLKNQLAQVQLPGGGTVVLAGLEPLLGAHAKPGFLRALKNCPQSLRIVLLHEPMLARCIPAGAADLILAGHTHGGQIHVPLLQRAWLPLGTDCYEHGMYRVRGMALYVSAGLGESGLKIRMFCPREVAVLHCR